VNDVDFNFATEEIKQDINVCKKEYKTVSGIVRDCNAFCPLYEVTVKVLTEDDIPLAHTTTGADGQFTIITEYTGNIKMVFYKPGYTTVYMSLVTSDYLSVSMCADDCDSIIVEGTLKSFTKSKLEEPIRITLKNTVGNKKETYLNEDNKFYFSEVESGQYKITIDGNQVETCSKCIEVNCGFKINYLEPIYIKMKKIYNTVNGVIKNCGTAPLVNNAVALYSKKTNKPVSVTLTNENGEYFFGNLDNDLYYIKVYLS